MAANSKSLRLDSKRRITLGKLAAKEVTSYNYEVKDNGVIVLYPNVEIPAEELWLYQNKEALASVLQGLEEIKAGKLVELEDDFWDGIEADV